jgi:hypothetical protein
MNLPELVFISGICVIVPIAALITALLFRRMSGQERICAIEKGVALPMERVSPKLRAARVRRGGIVLVALGLGVALTFVVGFWVEKDRDMLIAAALGFIPGLIGAGLLIDYRMLRKEIAEEQ